MRILAVNAGSSSVKAALFEDGAEVARGKVTRLGGDPVLEAGGTFEPLPRGVPVRDAALALADRLGVALDAVAHRVVHGGDRAGPERLTNDLLDALAALMPFAPLHQPASLAIATALRDAMPEAAHVACFDTAFHQTIPEARRTFAVPEALRPKSVRRYGFHGLSYAHTAALLADERPDLSRVVALHLGSGASFCAIRDGQSVATTMSLTPLDGVPMGTRSGALDPGFLIYLMRQGLSPDEIEDALYRRSGLAALSGMSNDVRDLRASPDPRAAMALEVFAEAVAEAAAALTVPLGGADALVFSGGIGVNDPAMRAAITGRLSHLPPFETFVSDADEQAVMAREAAALLT